MPDHTPPTVAGRLRLRTDGFDRAAELWIGPADPDDIKIVTELLREAGLSREGIATCADTCLVVRHGKMIVGAAALEIYGPAGLLRSVVVAPFLRGRGVGLRLTTAALELARHHRVRTVYLLTRGATGFFARIGFTPVLRSDVVQAVRQSAEFSATEPDDAVVMQLVLE